MRVINPMGHSAPWANYVYIIAFQKVLKYWELILWELVPLGPTLLLLLSSR